MQTKFNQKKKMIMIIMKMMMMIIINKIKFHFKNSL